MKKSQPSILEKSSKGYKRSKPFMLDSYALAALSAFSDAERQRFKNTSSIIIAPRQVDGVYPTTIIVSSPENDADAKTLFNSLCAAARSLENDIMYIPSPRNKNGEHPNKVGDSIKRKVTVYAVGIFCSINYGMQYVYRIQDEDKNEYTYMTRKIIDFGDFTMTARVKKLDDYNDVNTTTINYVRFYETENDFKKEALSTSSGQRGTAKESKAN